MTNNIKKLKGNTATLGLTNFLSLTIKIDETGDNVYYQYNGGNDNTIYTAEIEYMLKSEIDVFYEVEGEEDFLPCFKIGDEIYFLDEFLRDDL